MYIETLQNKKHKALKKTYIFYNKEKNTPFGENSSLEAPPPIWQAHGFMQLPLSCRGFIYCGVSRC